MKNILPGTCVTCNILNLYIKFIWRVYIASIYVAVECASTLLFCVHTYVTYTIGSTDTINELQVQTVYTFLAHVHTWSVYITYITRTQEQTRMHGRVGVIITTELTTMIWYIW